MNVINSLEKTRDLANAAKDNVDRSLAENGNKPDALVLASSQLSVAVSWLDYVIESLSGETDD